ncbi:hypothetical protein [Pseudonocardia terrae]|nr:hypothetical protein [Pseudonocardia terrae]
MTMVVLAVLVLVVCGLVALLWPRHARAATPTTTSTSAPDTR